MTFRMRSRRTATGPFGLLLLLVVEKCDKSLSIALNWEAALLAQKSEDFRSKFCVISHD